MTTNKSLFQAIRITKDFPGTRALDSVSFSLEAGEIHALVGENGAGKSTLIKIIAGIISADRGELFLEGIKCLIRNPLTAQKLGIGVVSQENNLVPTLTVAQNIYLAHEPLTHGFVLNKKKAVENSQNILSSFGIRIDPNMLLHTLSIAQIQMISIARALSFQPKILLLDEPTSSLSEGEIERLYSILKGLKEKGTGILYVSHRLEEIFKIADRVTVLRDGELVDTQNVSETNVDDIITKMVGRAIANMYPKENASVGDEAIRLVGVSKRGVCNDISLVVKQGEVVGLFGLVGAGRTELARIIFGLDEYDQGEIYIFGKKLEEISPSDSIKIGLGYLPEDRRDEGLCTALSVRHNILRASLRKLFPTGIKNQSKEKAITKKYVQDLAIATPSIDKTVSLLSGGTQQKVVFAHWMCAGSKIVILDEPTKGIDVGTKVEIYKMMNRLASEGAAILLISSDLPELVSMSDRVYVMYKGNITKDFIREDINPERIVSYAIGVEDRDNGK
jgi:ABC-type sugar transport system ATPase subunit